MFLILLLFTKLIVSRQQLVVKITPICARSTPAQTLKSWRRNKNCAVQKLQLARIQIRPSSKIALPTKIVHKNCWMIYLNNRNQTHI